MNQQERDAISAIEKQIGVRLKECPLEDVLSIFRNNSYSLNEGGELVGLNISENKLSDISILRNLINITHLNLSCNFIKNIDALHEMKGLIKLNLWMNQISDIDKLNGLVNLKELDLNTNNLTKLPEWILDWNLPIVLGLDFYGGIFVDKNPLTIPPIEIIAKGNDAIRDYFNQLKKEDSDYIYEAKLILVGEGGSGKTSLANKIIKPDWELIPESESESTQGIAILRYEFPFKDKKFRVNIWDFGGQEIYHQTHQFFLTKRSLYLLLADNRKEDGDFYYWLNTVSILSEDSPLLIIQNEKGDRQRQLPESELRAEFNNLKESLATNLKDNRGLGTKSSTISYLP